MGRWNVHPDKRHSYQRNPWRNLSLEEELIRAVEGMGLRTPLPMQILAIKQHLELEDLVIEGSIGKF